jgi:hypothetical protein
MFECRWIGEQEGTKSLRRPEVMGPIYTCDCYAGHENEQLRIAVGKMGMVVHACNPSSQEVEA